MLGLRLIKLRQGEADVNKHIVADYQLWQSFQASLLDDTPEINFPHEQIVLAVYFDDLTGDSQTHTLLTTKS